MSDPLPPACDVLVIGAGPAGCSAALYAASAGCAVLLVDRAAPRRDKICGDALTPRAVYLLAQLGIGPPDLRAAGAQEVAALVRHRADGAVASATLPGGPGLAPRAFGLPRRNLDALLWQRAAAGGVQLRSHCRVAAVRVDDTSGGQGIAVRLRQAGQERTVAAGVAILAVGSASALPGRLGFAPRRAAWGIGVRQYFACEQPPAAYHLFERPEFGDGCGWVFPAGLQLLNVGAGITPRGPELRAGLRAAFAAFVAAESRPGGLLWGARPVGRGETAPIHMQLRDRVVGDGVLLVGDAAGMASPGGGEGVPFALESGMWAGQAAAAALRLGDVSRCGLAQYEVEVQRRLGFLAT